MRMWMVDPKCLCNRHLLGEHVELHMAVGSITKGRSIKGFIDKGRIEIHSISSRHKVLVEEMEIRGMKHKSELNSFEYETKGCIDIEDNYKELQRRCKECCRRIKKWGGK